jgi:hypothetical protein
MNTKTNNAATEGFTPLLCYAFFWGKILRKWDWWIYSKACGSLRRMALENHGISYLFELNIRRWNEQLKISPKLRRSTELFHEALINKRVKPSNKSVS